MDIFLKRLWQCKSCTRRSLRIELIRSGGGGGRRKYYSTTATATATATTKANEDLASRGVTIVDLEQEYDRTLREMVRDNIDVLRKHATKDNGDQMPQRGEKEVDTIIKNAVRTLNRNYQVVRRERCQIPRKSTTVKLYNRFLRQLYGGREGGRMAISSEGLYKSYQLLPYPAPLYIQPQHLEDLLSLFMSTRWGKGNRGSQGDTIFLNILADLTASNMPISAREYNSAIYMTAAMDSAVMGDYRMPLIEDRFNQMKLANNNSVTDVSSLNMMMMVALGADNMKLFDEMMGKFGEYGLKPDRHTMLVYLTNFNRKRDIDGVKSVFQDMQQAGFVIDMPLMNLMMSALIKNGEFPTAEAIFKSLLQHPLKLAKPKPYSGPRLMRQIQLIDHFHALIKQSDNDDLHYGVPTIPDLTTFRMFLHYYCNHDDYDQVMETFQTMIQHGVHPTRHEFYRILRCFGNNSDQWHNLGRLKFVLVEILENADAQEDLTYILAELALRAYKKVSPTSKVGDLWYDIKNQKTPRQHVVYNTIKRLIDM